MKPGFRSWLYRVVAVLFGLVGLVVFLSLAELSRFYGFPRLQPIAGIGLGISFLLLTSSLLGMWMWKRYFLVSLGLAIPVVLGYLAFRPEMVRDDVLKQLVNPPLTVDLVGYRTFALEGDPERELKIERLQLLYAMVKSYGERAAVPAPEPTPAPQ